MNKPLLAFWVLSLLAGPMLAHAVVIVDTGTPAGGFDKAYRFAASEYFGGEFTISNTYAINSVEGYVSNDLGPAGSVSAGVYRDGGSSPGALLFSIPFSIASFARENWYGVFGLNWVLDPGTYWVAFVPDSNIEGLQRGGAASPLFSDINFDGTWQDNNCCGGQGWRINASLPSIPNPVPAPGTISLLGLGLAGLAAARRRKH